MQGALQVAGLEGEGDLLIYSSLIHQVSKLSGKLQKQKAAFTWLLWLTPQGQGWFSAKRGGPMSVMSSGAWGRVPPAWQ